MPVVFAEMNQMYGRVGIKLERSGSSESAINTNSQSSVLSGYASPIGSRCGSYDNSNFTLSPNIASMKGSFRVHLTDIIVTQEGDAHLLRLQEVCAPLYSDFMIFPFSSKTSVSIIYLLAILLFIYFFIELFFHF